MKRFVAALFALLTLTFAPLAHAQYYPPPSGWKLLGSATISGPVTSVEFTSSTIGNSSELYIYTDGIWCSSTMALYFAVGYNSTYTSGNSSIAQCPSSSSPAVIGGAYIPYLANRGMYISGFAQGGSSSNHVYQSSYTNPSNMVSPYQLSGKLNSVKFDTFGGGDMNSGTIYLYGR